MPLMLLHFLRRRDRDLRAVLEGIIPFIKLPPSSQTLDRRANPKNIQIPPPTPKPSQRIKILHPNLKFTRALTVSINNSSFCRNPPPKLLIPTFPQILLATMKI